MEFSKNSWHYKLACHGNDNNLFESDEIRGQISLCPYVWKIIFGLFKGVFAGFVMAILTTATLTALYAVFSMLMFVFSGLTGLYFPDIISIDLGAIAGISTLILTVCGLFAYVWAWTEGDVDFFPKYITKYFPNKPKKDIKAKELNILIEWAKAKKNKVCPMITFKE